MTKVCQQFYDGVKRTPKQRVEEACAWIADDYPRKWLRLVDLCENAAKSGWKRIRRGDLFILAGQQGMTITECSEFRFDNTLWSSLSRYLLMFRPNLAGVIFPRKSPALDAVDFEEVWRNCVRPQTFFLASSWQEAADAYQALDVSAA